MFTCSVILIVLIAPYLQCEVFNRIITTLNHTKLKQIPVFVKRRSAFPGQVPYIVVIKEPAAKGTQELWFNMCAGSIIDEYRVLTVAHCFEYHNFMYVKDPQSLRIVAGNQIDAVARTDYELDYDEYFTTQWRTISNIKIHKGFHFPVNDIAIIKINSPFMLQGDVGYIRPAKQSDDKLDNCLSAGYIDLTLRGGNVTAPKIMVTPISVVSSKNCTNLWEMNMTSFVCSESAVKDTIGLDIGGPLVCRGLITATSEDTERLQGIASGKTIDQTILYTRVSPYYGWLVDNGYSDHGPSTVLNYNLLMYSVLYVLLNYIL